MIEPVKAYLLELQSTIIDALIAVDLDIQVTNDPWVREAGGGGLTRVLSNGQVFDKAGVNFSHVHGQQLPPSASASRPELAGRGFQAMGVSLVIHPINPFVPTSHANVRFFIAESDDQEPIWWFGGGFDLTPCYGFDEDAIHWHQVSQKACGEERYLHYKRCCDDYFYLPHRQETRGVGGLFFDDLDDGGFSQAFEVTRSIGDHFTEAYLPIVERRMNTVYDESHKQWQEFRRARYVEFNLVYDRGTLFGLQSGGRTESILMSMPPVARWGYQFEPVAGSEEARLISDYLKPRDWLGLETISD